MNKNKLYTGLLILILSLCALTEISTIGMQQKKRTARYLTAASYPARASPGDSTNYSIRMKGRSNSVTINGKVVVSPCDTTEKQNNIRVHGEENTVTIEQTDQNSKVNITQQGKKNQIHITQK
ncbi:MAG: hypothetical protein PHT07_04185 [Paludibacter sp.]|nr:hypothetical protein [Paludibacter sp.]